MKAKPKEPDVPHERAATMRRHILSLLSTGTWTARELSGEIGLSEKDVYEHLEHIRRSTHGSGHRLAVTPAECKKCGYRFIDRERLTRPGKCPACRSEAIRPPAFEIHDR